MISEIHPALFCVVPPQHRSWARVRAIQIFKCKKYILSPFQQFALATALDTRLCTINNQQ
ncbi:hypothetical protein QTP88_006913 [Uroleucon formosanum]